MLTRRRLIASTALRALGCAFGKLAVAQPKPQFGPWGFDMTGIDRNAKPGDSFSAYANGAWDARTSIPADKSRFGSFDQLRDRSEDQLRRIVDDAAKDSSDTEMGKIGALYRSFMDEARIEQLDAAPIADDLAKIRAATTKADIATLMGRASGGVGASFFRLSVSLDQKNPTRYALNT